MASNYINCGQDIWRLLCKTIIVHDVHVHNYTNYTIYIILYFCLLIAFIVEEFRNKSLIFPPCQVLVNKLAPFVT